MEIPDQLHCLFSAQIHEQDGAYRIEIPDDELRLGTLDENETYRVALVPAPNAGRDSTDSDADRDTSPTEPARDRGNRDQPVSEGETRTVEIEDLGEQGDGITRVERGFVVIVPDTEQGERVTIEITDVTDTVAFAEVQERLSYYD